MHDIDRTLADIGSELEFEGEFEADFGDDEYEAEFEADYGDEGEYEYDYDGEYEQDEYEADFGEGEGVFDEEEEYQLAAELLATTNDEELEQFLGSLIKRAGRKLKKFVKRGPGQVLVKGLRGIARKALPIVGGAAGTYFGGPAGGAIGSRLAKAGGRVFSLELEGLSGEDQEFEVARRVVRLTGVAAKNAAIAPSSGSPVADAKKAMVKAAKVHAPGLLMPVSPRMQVPVAGGVGGRSGRWVRRGHKIVLMGV